MRRFVVVVDMQADFVRADGALPVPGADRLIGPAQAWLAALDPAETEGVLFTLDTHVPDIYAVSPEAAEFPPHCVRGSEGWALLLDPAVIDPAIPSYRLEKGVFDMWAEADAMIEPIRGGAAVSRDACFADLRVRGVTGCDVIGVAADYCVRWAVEGLVARGFDVRVVAALTEGIARPITQVARDEWPAASVEIA